MSQQVTFRVGRGPQASPPAPARASRLIPVLFDAVARAAFYGLALLAIVLTIGVNPLNVR